QVELEGNAIMLSATSRINYLKEKEKSRQVKILQDSLDLIESQLKILAGEKSVYAGEEKLINENNKLGSEQSGVQVTELKLLSEFYRTRLMDIKKQVIAIEEKELDLKDAKVRIQRQLNDLNALQNKPTGEIVLNLAASSPVKVKVRVSYLTSNAGWYPVYDIRSESTVSPIKLIYKANIYQSTGYDWKDVKMSVSTRNPEADQNRPILNPWFIDFYQPEIQVLREYKRAEAPAAMNIYQEAVEEDAMASEPLKYVVTETSGMMATEYAIENRQSIPSDSKEHMVAVKEFEVNANYTYHSVPKLSDGVFLLAKLADFGSLSLLPGTANLFNEGMYVGQSDINPFTTADTMMISLGRDEKISIKRTVLKDLTARQTIGTNIKETKGFELLIKNNKSIPVDLEILDNIPISKNKDIEVNLDADGGGNLMKEYGRLLWRVQLKSGESRKIDYSFSVKYPKDKTISGL
ncbi:MAG TPA: DUF4139 domain-containing protein, partial [Bacteroidales bacterium]|nr:DUF4139 domain-containing protein [Bacteroidales bacterium]